MFHLLAYLNVLGVLFVGFFCVFLLCFMGFLFVFEYLFIPITHYFATDFILPGCGFADEVRSNSSTDLIVNMNSLLALKSP